MESRLHWRSYERIDILYSPAWPEMNSSKMVGFLVDVIASGRAEPWETDRMERNTRMRLIDSISVAACKQSGGMYELNDKERLMSSFSPKGLDKNVLLYSVNPAPRSVA